MRFDVICEDVSVPVVDIGGFCRDVMFGVICEIFRLSFEDTGSFCVDVRFDVICVFLVVPGVV